MIGVLIKSGCFGQRHRHTGQRPCDGGREHRDVGHQKVRGTDPPGELAGEPSPADTRVRSRPPERERGVSGCCKSPSCGYLLLQPQDRHNV